MGGGSSSSSSSQATSDNDVMLDNGSVNVGAEGQYVAAEHLQNVDNGSVLADEVGSVKHDSENINVAGSSNVITQFGDSAARVVSEAIQTVESVTSKNLQLQTDKDVLSEELESERAFTWDDVKDLFENPKVQAGLAVLVVGGGLMIWRCKK